MTLAELFRPISIRDCPRIDKALSTLSQACERKSGDAIVIQARKYNNIIISVNELRKNKYIYTEKNSTIA